MKHWTLQIKISVADSWVADGFDASERIEEIQEQIAALLPYAYGDEIAVKVKILSKPDAKVIVQLQNGELEAKD